MRIVSFNERVEQLNRKLEYYLFKIDQKKARFDEKHIVASASFQLAISKARRELGIEDEYLDFEPDLQEWIVSRLSGEDAKKISSEEYFKHVEKFQLVAIKATEEANLPYGWQDYVGAYIALGEAPREAHIEPTLKIEVEEFTEDDNSIIIRLDKGLSSEEYKKAWKALKGFLQQPSEYQPYAHTLKNKIYLDHKAGMTAGEIAKRYFPKEYKIDRIAAVDKVKKVISRYR